MAGNKHHLNVGRFFTEEPFKSKSMGRNPNIPKHDRTSHGSNLNTQYQTILDNYSFIEKEREE